MIVGVDPDGDEPAGADEEWRYFKIGKTKGPEKVEEQVQDVLKQVVLPESFQGYDSECVPDDEAVLVASSLVLNLLQMMSS